MVYPQGIYTDSLLPRGEPFNHTGCELAGFFFMWEENSALKMGIKANCSIWQILYLYPCSHGSLDCQSVWRTYCFNAESLSFSRLSNALSLVCVKSSRQCKHWATVVRAKGPNLLSPPLSHGFHFPPNSLPRQPDSVWEV